ncbi:hypothetical protein [Hafnia paralvei]|jgi:hypothetical protein|uniref:hypothetical protein n=1 Tax=Hafnia paralvei TaxID=546367 RepID=UPI0014199E55|nr:hypothetical protein [Hafnia paralvei]NIH33149.1 hypothetical protein [Hafnia paralvei]
MKHLPPPLFVLLVGFTLGLGVGSIANYYLLNLQKDELLGNFNNLHVESIYNLNTNESILTFKSVHQSLCGEYINHLASSPLKEINVIINGVRFARSKTRNQAVNACLPDDGILGQNVLVLYSAGRSK